MSRTLIVCSVCGSLMAILLSTGCVTKSSPFLMRNTTPDINLFNGANLKLGGQLYDDWFEIKTDIDRLKGPDRVWPPVRVTNPLYPRVVNAEDLGDTWRCSKCHGWDFRGEQPTTAEKQPSAKLPDLLGARTKTPLQLFQTIAAGKSGHDFGKYLSEPELWALVRFLGEGMVDTRQLIGKDARFKGDVVKGDTLFKGNCAKCHGNDGDRLDFRSKKGIQGIGWRSNGNPEATLHRVRWGVWRDPVTIKVLNEIMPSAKTDLGLSDQQIIDILAYAQTLGKKP